MNQPVPGSDAWLAQVQEDIIDPDRPIVDPHHHLWKNRLGRDYLLDGLWQDTQSGHNVVKTIFMECRAFYHKEGPEHLLCLGETEYVTAVAQESQANEQNKAHIAALVGRADLTLDEGKLVGLLESHNEISEGLFRGIRHSGAHDERPEDLMIAGRAPANLYAMEDFRNGLRLLAKSGLTYDTWHYHHQNQDFCELAQAIPEVTMILDHFGTPLGVGVYKGHEETIFQQWKEDIAAIAKCENVYAKLGGLAMPDNGFGWNHDPRPPGSDEFVEKQKRYYLHTIECFGPDRCMFESNFPVDKLSISYPIVWNGFKKMVADFSEDEKNAMFYGTAARVYKLDDIP